MKTRLHYYYLFLFLTVCGSMDALACAVCYGEPDSPVSRGLSWAIFALGAIVMMVLSGAVAFFVQANRKATVLQTAESPETPTEKP